MLSSVVPFSTVTVLVRGQEGHLACKDVCVPSPHKLSSGTSEGKKIRRSANQS